MKMIKRLSSLLLLIMLSFIGLTSCSNILFNTLTVNDGDNNAKTGTVYGMVTTNGALSRSAYPVIDVLDEPDDYEYSVFAYTTSINTPQKEGTLNEDCTEFTISGLEFNKNYTIAVQVKNLSNDEIILQGTSDPFQLTGSAPVVNIDEAIKLKPLTGGTGNISLPLYFDDGLSFTTIKCLLDGEECEPISTSSPTVELSDIDSGSHKLTLQFYNTVDGVTLLLYQCTEQINVFNGMLTELWIKNGNEPHLKVTNGTVEFHLSNDALESFAQDTVYVNTNSSVSHGNGTFWHPFASIKDAVTAVKTSSSNALKTIFVKAGSESDVQLSAELSNKNIHIETYTSTPGDGQGTFSIQVGSSFHLTVTGGGSLSLSGISFSQNSTSETLLMGRFISVEENSSLTCTNCSFTGGKTELDGGAINCEDSRLNLNNTVFSGNTSAGEPIAITCSNTDVTLSGKTYTSSLSTPVTYDIILLKAGSTITMNSPLTAPNASYTGKWAEIDISDISSGSKVFKGNCSNKSSYFVIDYSTDYDFLDSTDTLRTVPSNALYVDSSATGSSGTGTYRNPCTTISSAISKVSDSKSLIYVKSGTYSSETEKSIYHDTEIKVYSNTPFTADTDTGTATISSTGANTWSIGSTQNNELVTLKISKIIFDANNETKTTGFFRVFSSNGVLELTDCTLKNCKCSSTSPAIETYGTLTLTDCILTNNKCGEMGRSLELLRGSEVYIYGSTYFGENDYIRICGTNSDTEYPRIYIEETLTPPSNANTSWKLDFYKILNGNQIFNGASWYSSKRFFVVGPDQTVASNAGAVYIDDDGKFQTFITNVSGLSSTPAGETFNAVVNDTYYDTIIQGLFGEGANSGNVPINLDLSHVSPEKISTLEVTLRNVETLVLPAGASFTSNNFQNKPANLKKVVVSGDISGSWLFQDCSTIEEVVFEEGVTQINQGMFCGCQNITSITLPSTLKTIKNNAFSNTNITEITIPQSVTRIEWCVFRRTDGSYASMNADVLQRVIFEDPQGWKFNNATLTIDGNIVDFSDAERMAELFLDADYGAKNSSPWTK